MTPKNNTSETETRTTNSTTEDTGFTPMTITQLMSSNTPNSLNTNTNTIDFILKQLYDMKNHEKSENHHLNNSTNHQLHSLSHKNITNKSNNKNHTKNKSYLYLNKNKNDFFSSALENDGSSDMSSEDEHSNLKIEPTLISHHNSFYIEKPQEFTIVSYFSLLCFDSKLNMIC